MATSTIGTLVINIIANTGQLASGLARGASQMGVFQRGVGRLSSAMLGVNSAFIGAAGSTVAFGLTFNRILSSAREFNKAMAQTTSIMGNLTDKQREALELSARNLASSTKFGTTEAVAALRTLSSSGLSAEQAARGLGVAGTFAQAGLMDLDEATKLLVTSQGALGLKVRDADQNMRNMVRVANALTKANDLATGEVIDFANALTTKSAGMARNFGKDLEEVTAVLMAFAEQGVLGEEAGTAFSIVLRDLSTKAIENADAFKLAGVEVFDSAGKLNHVGDIVKDLEQALAGLSDEEKKQTLLLMGFADRSVNFLLNLVGTGDRIKEFDGTLRESAGYMADVANKTIPQFEKEVNKLSAAWDNLATSMGRDFLESSQTNIGALALELERWADDIRKDGFLSSIFYGHGPDSGKRFFSAPGLPGLTRAPGPDIPDSGLFSAPGAALASAVVSNLEKFQSIIKSGVSLKDELEFDKQWWDDVETIVKGLTQDADKLRDAMTGFLAQAQTPAERFADSMLSIDVGLQKGVLSLEKYGRLAEHFKEQLFESVKASEALQQGGTPFLAAGTGAAFSAVQASRREFAGLQAKGLDLDTKRNKLLEEGNKLRSKEKRPADSIIFNQVTF